jgi:hypothetical protein
MSILSSGTSNTTALVYTSDTTGNLVFQTNGTTEAMRITSGANVGVGTSTPINPLDVVGNVRSILQSTGDQTGVTLGNNGTTNPRIQFSTSDGTPRYIIQGNGNSSLDFINYYAGTPYTAMSLGRTTNNLVFGQNGSGIQFTNSSATTNSVLNDYETGTWTPTYGNMTTSGTVTTSGRYTKIGNMVFVTGYISATTSITWSTSALINLPFTGVAFGHGHATIRVNSSSSNNQNSNYSGVQNSPDFANARFFVGTFTAAGANEQLQFTATYPANF